jgi:hypothetical protein
MVKDMMTFDYKISGRSFRFLLSYVLLPCTGIEAGAKRRLADEYDAAQERGTGRVNPSYRHPRHNLLQKEKARTKVGAY